MTVVGPDQCVRPVTASSDAAWPLRLFSRMWACAALFHLAGNSSNPMTASPGLAVASAALALAAALTLLMPHRRRWLVLLCALVPVTAWYEAPVIGNHWVLASTMSLALLLAALCAGPSGGLRGTWALFAPTARAALLLAYGFAAFAKLNTGFFDPAVSCAVYYHNQLVGSWGLDLLLVPVGAPVGRALAVAAALTEACVAIGLALPRTRRAALVLAVSFHWLLAMDLGQHFWDFSSVLFAGFLLFLDEDQVVRLRRWTSWLRARRLIRPVLLNTLVVTVSAVVAVIAVLPSPRWLDAVLVVMGHLTWWCYGTAVVLVVLALVRTPKGARTATTGMRPAGLLYLVPVLVLINGLTPYLELKTGFGWNMYSNLRTVAGESNHLLVPATLDLTGLQTDQVRIVESSDPALDRLRSERYAIAYSEFREYAVSHPDVAVTYERGGRVVRAERLADDPAGQGTTTALSRRLQSFRVIDLASSERCQPGFSPAR